MTTLATILNFLPLILLGGGILFLAFMAFVAYYIYRRMG
jgi:hypothetical protein